MNRFLLLLLPCALLAQTPDRPALPEEWGYHPAEAEKVAVNPPAFTWPGDGAKFTYDVEWSRKPDFTAAQSAAGLPWSAYTHNRPLATGTWYWHYRIVAPGAKASAWSKTRSFIVTAAATEFPQPSMAELATRIPKTHPRLFLTQADLPRLREWAQGGGAQNWKRILARADQLLKAEPTPEPTVMGTISNPETRDHWWSNRVQTMRACQEGELLAFAYLLSGDKRYGEGARKWALHLASWNPDGPTNWRLNDEAAMPILHRMARIYDWAYDALTPEDRAKVRASLLRRAQDCWKGGQTGEGWGHINRPYNSHGNRSWHKLAENAIATFGETPESEKYLHFAVSKFFAAYPVWSDDDGGWHEGLSYWAGYMVKATWWFDIARTALGIDGFKKPYFAHFGDYALYTAPPGSATIGFGDLATGGVNPSWNFVRYFTAGAKNPYWAWWADQSKIVREQEEPVMGFLWGSRPQVAPKAPTDLPSSKVFNGIGVAILNSDLTSAANNVQVRFKSSPFGRQSHGHDAHNALTLAAYGDALLVNNVWRDYYGSPFHKEYVWTTGAQNALLVDGAGQKPHSADPFGKIVAFRTSPTADYVAGDATAAYQGKLTRYIRHIVFLKPGIIVVADEVEAPREANFQLMYHAQAAFELDAAHSRAIIERNNSGAIVEFDAPGGVKLTQTTGYNPEPDWKYLKDASKSRIPPQWHIEAATGARSAKAMLITVIRPYRKGARPDGAAVVTRNGDRVTIAVGGRTITLRPGTEFFSVR